MPTAVTICTTSFSVCPTRPQGLQRCGTTEIAVPHIWSPSTDRDLYIGKTLWVIWFYSYIPRRAQLLVKFDRQVSLEFSLLSSAVTRVTEAQRQGSSSQEYSSLGLYCNRRRLDYRESISTRAPTLVSLNSPVGNKRRIQQNLVK